MWVFCFTLSMSGSYSVLLYASIWVLLKKKAEREADYTEQLQLPLTTHGFCQVEPPSFNFPSSLFHSSSHLFQVGVSCFNSDPSPFCYKHSHVIHVKSIGPAQESQYGANRFYAFGVQFLRQEKQTQLKQSDWAK